MRRFRHITCSDQQNRGREELDGDGDLPLKIEGGWDSSIGCVGTPEADKGADLDGDLEAGHQDTAIVRARDLCYAARC